MQPASKFEQVLGSVELLSVDEQEALLDLVHRRLAERQRYEIAAKITQAQTDYQAGRLFRGTVEQIMDELRQFAISIV